MGSQDEGWDLASDVVVLTAASSSASASEDEQQQQQQDDFEDLEELQLFRVEGCDKDGRRIVRLVGKFFPALVIDKERLKRYILLKLEHFEHERFAIVYFHTNVQRDENSPGIRTLRHIYQALSAEVKQKLEVVYFVHPGIRSRLVFATLGRIFLSDRLYWKLKYINRIEFLRDHIKDGQVEIPEFVFEHDDELEQNPLSDYGICVDPLEADLRTDNPRYPTRAFF